MSETGVYLFCFAENGGTLRLSPGFMAVTEEVALDEFTPEHLEDPEWVSARACRHEQVIEAAMRHSAVLPARFGTVFSSLERLEEFAAAHAEAIGGFLRRVAGQDEWGLKAFAKAAAAARPEGAAAGTRYLLERKNRGARLAGTAAALEALASAAVERTAIEPGVVRSWAFLVPREGVEEFRAQVDRAAAEAPRFNFILSGPWPPYSFVPELGTP